MTSTLENSKREELLFFTSYILWMTAGVLKITMFFNFAIIGTACDYAQKLAYLLLVCLFFMRRRDTLKDAIGLGLILLCCILANHSVYNIEIIPVATFIYFSADFNYRKILKYTLILQAAIMIIAVLASQTGIVEDVIWEQGDRMRHSLGYEYCGYPAHLLLFMSLIWFCLRKKINAIEIIIVLLLNYVMYVFTDSRTDLILTVVGVLGYLVWDREYSHRWINEFRAFVVKFGFVIAAVVSILVQAIYNPNNSIMSTINRALNGRLRLGNEALQTYGVTLFGQKVRWFGQGSLKADPTRVYNYVDNAFLKDGISYGIIFLILLGIAFYLTGKMLIAQKEYRLSWAMLVSLFYAVLNAHLCYLVFNVFILLLGFCYKKTKNGEISVKEWIAARWNERTRRILRTGLFLVALLAVTYAQIRGTGYMVSYSGMFTWIICGILLLLACLCLERDPYNFKITGSWFGKLVVICLLLFCISDFFVEKKFQFAAFGLLAFGGIFCKCWGSMDNPNRLITEFKLAYKIWFVAAVIFCILCRPITQGICYTGLFPDAESFALSMMIALIIFLSDILKKRTCILNGTGAVCALYFIWVAKKTEIVLVVCLILTVYAVFWIWQWIKTDRKEKIQRAVDLAAILVGGAALVFIVRSLLPVVSSSLGTQIVYEKDKTEKIGVTLLQLNNIQAWKDLFGTKFSYCMAYLRNLNLLGHNYLLEINGKKRWTSNSIVMVGYRYGIIAGICYLGVLMVSFVQLIRCSLRRKDFLWAGVAFGCIIACMVTPIEKPFVCIIWMILWLCICWIGLWECALLTNINETEK